MSPPALSMLDGGGPSAAGCHIRRRLAAPRRLTPRFSVAAPATLTAANSAAGTTSQRARPRSVPTRSPTAQTSDGQPERDLDPRCSSPGRSRCPGGHDEREPERDPAEGRGRGGGRGAAGGAEESAMAASSMRTDAPASVVRGDQSAIATPIRTSARPTGLVGNGPSPRRRRRRAATRARWPGPRCGGPAGAAGRRPGRQQQVASEVPGDADAIEEGEDDEPHPGPHRRHTQRRRQAAAHPGQHPVPAAPDPVPRRRGPRRRRECALRIDHIHDFDSTEGSGWWPSGGSLLEP